MPKKISQFGELTEPNNNDWLLMETVGGVYRKVKRSNVVGNLGNAFTLNYQNQILLDCPDRYFLCNDTAGTVATDFSGFNQNGTYELNRILQRPGLVGDGGTAFRSSIGGALTFNQPFFGAALTESGTGLTMECLIRVNTISSNSILSVGGITPGGSEGFGVAVVNGNWSASVYGVQGVPSSRAIVAGQIVHLCFVMSKSQNSGVLTLNLWINGFLATTIGNSSFFNPSQGAAAFGGVRPYSGTTTQAIDADFDHCAFYRYALPVNRIMAHYAQFLKGV